jgi:hypothetical protein
MRVSVIDSKVSISKGHSTSGIKLIYVVVIRYSLIESKVEISRRRYRKMQVFAHQLSHINFLLSTHPGRAGHHGSRGGTCIDSQGGSC